MLRRPLQLLQAEWCVRSDGEKRGSREERGEKTREEKRKGRDFKNGQEPRKSYVALFSEIIRGMSEPEAITFSKS